MADIKVNKVSNLIQVNKIAAGVQVQSQGQKVVEVSAVGPQGPPFVGSSFFDAGAINALGSGDIGKVLKFDGTQFIPTNELETNLTINGGAF